MWLHWFLTSLNTAKWRTWEIWKPLWIFSTVSSVDPTLCMWLRRKDDNQIQSFLLFAVVMFYKGIANIDSVNTGLSTYPRGNTALGSCEPLLTFWLTDQYTTLFYVFLFKDILYNIYCWISSTESGQEYYNSCLNETQLIHMFSPWGISGSLCLGTLDN